MTNRVGFKPLKITKSILLSILLCGLTLGCTLIPEQKQFVSSLQDLPLTRSNGSCSDSIVAQEFGRTDSSTAKLSADSISILNWNIYKGQKQEWDTDLLQLSQSKDIIILQEAPLNDRLQEILNQENLYWNLNSAFIFNGTEAGVLVASSVPPLGSCGLRLSEPIISVPKTILISSYTITDSTENLLVANIHGINFSLGVGAYQKQLDSLQDVLTKHTGPIILAGDFNNWSKKRTAIMLKLAEKLSLQPLIYTKDSRTTFWGDPVDHVLYRGLEPVSHTVHTVTSSDHNPISVTFRLARKEPKPL
ncbi:MAG: endonuclease/exonuclease/phosphatase family protein [Desulfuromusa sp.]|nr:endonuclease/exonuclease/phosphatase family protein [Desulfuromusa sp.]